jgi:RNA polymerase sigma factor (sigma-70 family)
VVNDHRGASDRDLLLRFSSGNDQDAFTTLVNRHANMVMGVCQRALTNAADAEDACQATFLLLARKAKAGNWQPSIANWLYSAARKVARNARIAADRRARREGQAAVPDVVLPLDQMTGREAFAILDEELDRLPAVYREPLVLCYLQGLTRDEAAVRLRVLSATLKSQLERGRKRLGDSLTKRGVTLSAGLLALVATTRVGASPSRMIKSIQTIVSGEVPPTIAALTKGIAVNGVLKKLVIGVALLAVTAAIGIGLGQPTTTIAGQQAEKSKPEKQETKETSVAKAKPEQTIKVSGRVVDPDGKPVAGAKFAIIADEVEERIAEVKSGADGKFTFAMSYPKEVRNPRQVVASAPGFGVDWISEPREDAVFKLVPDLPIMGRVIDLQGKPVRGASVALHNIHAGTPEAFDALVKNWKKSADEQDKVAGKLERSIWNRGGLGEAFHTTTAADGSFTLAGCGKDRVVTLRISGAGIADTFADVVTQTGFDPKSAPKTPMRLYPPTFDLVVNPDKPVTGVVRDEATQKPLAGIRVIGAAMLGELHFGTYHFHAWPTPHTTTDAAGKFTLRGLAKAKAYVLVADPEEGTEHLHRFALLEDSTAFTPITADFTLPRGVVVTGRVTDAATGAGVPSRVFYRPLMINDQLGNFGGYDPPDYPAPWHRGRDTKTDMDGRFKITVMPGAGVVNFQAYGGSYTRAKATQKEIDDGIVDKQFGHFRALGQGGMYNPEFMHAYKVIYPAAKDKTATLDVQVRPEEPPKPKDGK